MKTLMLAPIAYNMAETTRMIDIARACDGSFDIVFITDGGKYEELIEESGFELRRLNPRLTKKKIDHFYRIDRGEEIGHFFSKKEIREQVSSHVACIEEIEPVAIVTGFNLTTNISARVAKVPLVWVTQSTWLMRQIFEEGLGTTFDTFDLPVIRWLPKSWTTWLSGEMMAFGGFFARRYRKVGREFGVHLRRGYEWLSQGDHNLLAEPEGFSGLSSFPPNFRCIGPLLGSLDLPVPEEVSNMPRDRPIVYLAMGSSGNPKIMADIIEGFRGQPYTVVSPIKALAQEMKITPPENVIATSWLPAEKVNPMADISVVHGGIGTLMTAGLAGAPIVGVGMQPEQELNIECFVRKGFAIRIGKRRARSRTILKAIERLLSDDEAKRKARDFQAVLERWANPLLIASFFEETFGSPSSRA